MTWITLKDGWRDESDEGPYTETLQTLYNWNTKDNWEICRLRGNKKFDLTLNREHVTQFNTIEEAKLYVKGCS